MNCTIDWVATGTMLYGIGTVASALAILTAGIFGRKLLSDFTATKQAENQLLHAEKTLATAYQLRDVLASVRSPMSTAKELSDSEEELRANGTLETLGADGRRKRFVQANVFFMRIRRWAGLIEQAYGSMPYTRAYFGEDGYLAFRELVSAFNAVRIFADAYANNNGNDIAGSQRIEDTIWETGPSEDPNSLTFKLDSAIKTLELRLLPIIRPPSTDKGEVSGA